jgi:hypothetical protein
MIAPRLNTFKKSRSNNRTKALVFGASKRKTLGAMGLQKTHQIRIAIKRSISVKRKSTQRDVEKAALFAGISKSDSFTVEAAYKDFAFIALE